ncbi:MAG: rlmI [Gammaproteobacteria bacterium]|jgi:23S rRNA (cytosine1962-C5)-methyltransferase|nr:rlmI [Gammaproteobacteria bacterium]
MAHLFSLSPTIMPKTLRLKKNEDRRLRAGHLWIYSNEIDTQETPLKDFSPGEEILIQAYDKTPLGMAYINPHSLITARLFSRQPHAQLNLSLFIQRIQNALALRNRLFLKPYYRLIFGESDGLPGLIADRFGNTLVLQINTAGMEAKTELIIAAFQAVLPDIESILLRNDNAIRQQEGLDNIIQAGLGSPPKKVFLEENNASFYVPLWEGQKTGWFYDHRLNRSRLPGYVTGQRVLDVFSYVGGWGIQAANAGAKEVICIEASPLATTFIQENAELNQVTHKIRTLNENAFTALKELAHAKEKFGLIILDPPAFMKKLKDKKEGLLAYLRINEAALKLLSADGILISCSCSMHLTYDDLTQAIRRAGLHASCELQILERGHQAPDHPVHLSIPETDYLKMIIVRRSSL